MDYRIIKRENSVIDGLEQWTIVVTIAKSTLLTIKNANNMTERELVIAIFNEAIRLEQNPGKRQELARKRHNITKEDLK